MTVNSAESVDVVTHEQGHAFLDAIRPDFFEVPFIEVGALHEAFGDCVAILTRVRGQAHPGRGDQGHARPVGEPLRREPRRGPGRCHRPRVRRRATSRSAPCATRSTRFSWADPTTLPSNAPADELSGEVHSFARVFAGAFYDTIRNIYNSGTKNSNGLRKASRTAGELLIGAIRRVPAAPNTFAGVGQRMLQSDDAINNGANIQAIRDAFEAHGMTLAAAAASLPEPLPKAATAAKTELRRRLAVAPGTKVEVTQVESKQGDIAHVAAYRPLALDGRGLEGVRVMVPGSARVATRRGGRSLTGTLGEITPAQGEVDAQARAFVKSLLDNGDIKTAPRAMRRMVAPPQPSTDRASRAPTHEIRILGGEPTLVRIGFR